MGANFSVTYHACVGDYGVTHLLVLLLLLLTAQI
jgi:hypothetical protein